MNIKMGPMGKLIKGHVLDCSVKPFERALKDYWAPLYVKWNPNKLRGHGCYEIRFKPEVKTVRKAQPEKRNKLGLLVREAIPGDVYEFDGFTIAYPKYHENDLINHVMDVPFLNYSVLEKLKKMDMWETEGMGEKGKNFVKQAEYLEAKHDEQLEEKMTTELQYGLKQLKPEIKAFKEYVHRNGNPYRIADYWSRNRSSN